MTAHPAEGGGRGGTHVKGVGYGAELLGRFVLDYAEEAHDVNSVDGEAIREAVRCTG